MNVRLWLDFLVSSHLPAAENIGWSFLVASDPVSETCNIVQDNVRITGTKDI